MDSDDARQEPPVATARRSRLRPLWIVGAAALAAALIPGPATGGGRAAMGGGPASDCPAPAKPLRYPDVHPIFEQHCAKCHDSRQGKNDAAQAVFEMASYPFSTKRPATLLGDLRGMFLHRGSLSAAEKCRGIQWLAGGGLDAEGRPPRWR
jgi:hypothetical protein